MSDYIPKDPMGPNDPRGYDRYGNTRFEPADDPDSTLPVFEQRRFSVTDLLKPPYSKLDRVIRWLAR